MDEQTEINRIEVLISNPYYSELNEAVKLLLSDPKNMHKYIIKKYKCGSLYWGTILWYVVKMRNIELINVIINNCGINIRNGFGHTLLYYACTNVDYNMVKMLINNGADINILYDGRSILHILVSSCYYENKNLDITTNIVETLINNGANIHSKDNLGRTVMHRVMATCNSDMCKLLLSKGGDISVRDLYKISPFIYSLCPYKISLNPYSVSLNNMELVKVVIDHISNHDDSIKMLEEMMEYTKRYERNDYIELIKEGLTSYVGSRKYSDI